MKTKFLVKIIKSVSLITAIAFMLTGAVSAQTTQPKEDNKLILKSHKKETHKPDPKPITRKKKKSAHVKPVIEKAVPVKPEPPIDKK